MKNRKGYPIVPDGVGIECILHAFYLFSPVSVITLKVWKKNQREAILPSRDNLPNLIMYQFNIANS